MSDLNKEEAMEELTVDETTVDELDDLEKELEGVAGNDDSQNEFESSLEEFNTGDDSAESNNFIEDYTGFAAGFPDWDLLPPSQNDIKAAIDKAATIERAAKIGKKAVEMENKTKATKTTKTVKTAKK